MRRESSLHSMNVENKKNRLSEGEGGFSVLGGTGDKIDDRRGTGRRRGVLYAPPRHGVDCGCPQMWKTTCRPSAAATIDWRGMEKAERADLPNLPSRPG